MEIFQKILDTVASRLYTVLTVTNKRSKNVDLVTALDMLGSEVNERFPNIDSGGCCVYASIVAAALKKHDIEAVGIVASWTAEGSRLNIDKIRTNIEKNTVFTWNDNGISFTHVGLEFRINGRLKYYDSKGVKRANGTLDEMKVYKGRLSCDEMKKLAADWKGWNRSFNRDDIPALRRLVKSRLKFINLK